MRSQRYKTTTILCHAPEMTPPDSYKLFVKIHLLSFYLETIPDSLWTKLTDLDLIYKILPSTWVYLHWPLEKMSKLKNQPRPVELKT